MWDSSLPWLTTVSEANIILPTATQDKNALGPDLDGHHVLPNKGFVGNVFIVKNR